MPRFVPGGLRAGIAAAIAALALPVIAQDESAPEATPEARPSTLAQLERAFWLCDFVATTEGADAAPIAACRYVTDEVERRKFGGNFSRFVQWWREHKAAEFARLERGRKG